MNGRQGNGGRPNTSGTKSSILVNTRVASVHRSFGNSGSGNITTCMPAAFAPRTPFGESSNTKHCEQVRNMLNDAPKMFV